ncbi:MAG TPA: GntR family transcriptional regulator [Trueperaceae bacterium]|nr:GntR family transcriptional regulator [Trueperaceae bacterium]
MTKPELGRLQAPERDILSRQAYDALREGILSRTLPAGSKLIMRDLVEQLELSPTPINQALAALEREGLVESKPHRGYYVITLEPSDIVDIYTLREVLEGLAMRLAVEERPRELAAALREVHAEQVVCCEQGELGRYGDLDLAFHRIVWETSGNQRLLHMAEMLMGQVRLLISTSAEVEGRLPASMAEHEGILSDVERGDVDSAERHMRDHVRNAGTALLAYLGAELSLPGGDGQAPEDT